MKVLPLLALVLLSCTVTTYDGSIRVENQSEVILSDITYAGEPITEGSAMILPAGSSGEVAATLPNGYRYTFPQTVKISIREKYLITIYGTGEMREGTPRLYAKIQTVDR